MEKGQSGIDPIFSLFGDDTGGQGNQDPPKDDPSPTPGGSGNQDPKDDPSPGGKKDDPKPGDDSWLESQSEDVKKVIKALRSENAKYRTKSKNLGDELSTERNQLAHIKKALGIEDEQSPEEQVKELSMTAEQLMLQNAQLTLALENGISGDDIEYFQFLMNQRLTSLEDGEELSDEAMQEIVGKVKKVGGSGSTSVNPGQESGDNGGNPPAPGSKDEITVEQFANMTISEKSLLYGKNRELYNSLMGQAKQKGILV